jgi:hypothetical protein
MAARATPSAGDPESKRGRPLGDQEASFGDGLGAWPSLGYPKESSRSHPHGRSWTPAGGAGADKVAAEMFRCERGEERSEDNKEVHRCIW